MNLILFFNGWGMDKKCVENIKVPDDYILEVINFPYDYNIKKFKNYEKIYFIGWSFGCWYLSKYIIKNEIKSENIIAINGHSEIIGRYGISPKMLDFTLKNLTEKSLKKFYKNSGIPDNFTDFNKNFTFIKNELLFFKDNYRSLENIFTKAFIGKNDRIICFERQKKYFAEKKISFIEMDFPHYPFEVLNDWKEILEEKNELL